MKKFCLVVFFVLVMLAGECHAEESFETRVNNQISKLPSYLTEYVTTFQVKEKADYSIREGWVIFADANTDFVVTIYCNDVTDEQIYEILLHEIGHCVYWKHKMIYYDMEKWADCFRISSKWFTNIEDTIKFMSWIL